MLDLRRITFVLFYFYILSPNYAIVRFEFVKAARGGEGTPVGQPYAAFCVVRNYETKSFMHTGVFYTYCELS